MAVSNHDSPSIFESDERIPEIQSEESREPPFVSSSQEMGSSTSNRTVVYVTSLVPILFVGFLLSWTYVCYVFFWGIPSLQTHPTTTIVSLLLYHTFLFLTVYSYTKAILTDPGTVVGNFQVQPNLNEDANVCRKCGANKPERAHHCSICKKCIVKMDHHCPWINNCVGHRNHKYFMLFLTYLVLTCCTAFFSLIQWVIENVFKKAISFTQIQVLMTFIVAMIFGMVLSLFTFAQYRHVWKNVTTIEHSEKRRLWKRRRKQLLALKETRELSQTEKSELRGRFRSPYDIGLWRNFEQVFGENKWKWFLPFWTDSTVDGINWPTVAEVVNLVPV